MKHLGLIIAVCYLVVGCVTSRTIPVSPELATSEEEQMLWRQAEKEQALINGSGVLFQDTQIENYLDQIVKKLQKNSISADISFEIKIIKDPKLNAFALPHGAIYINTGILARMENEAQLATLLAHEMIHCTHRHSLRALRKIKERSRQAKPAAVEGFARLLGITGPVASIRRYTRELEVEADRVGLDLVVKANYDPREILTLFELLKQEMKTDGVEESYYFGTHPKIEQRIENVNKWLAENDRINVTGLKNTVEFQTKLSPLMLENARLDLRQGQFSTAQNAVKKYLAVNQDDARAYFLLGEIFRQRGWKNDAATAINYYQKSISLNPSLAESHLAMGLIHYKAGERRRAKKHFESCLLLSPNTADKAYIQGYLKSCAANGEGS
jgi:predicted Zn-dependent protease